MSPAERAQDDRQRLAAEVRREMARVGRVAADLAGALDALRPGCTPIVKMGVAGHLHSFYTGCESVLKHLLGAFGSLPQGAGWHRELLFQAMSGVEDVRPPVLSPGTAAALDDLMRFRHFFRASYGVDLDADRLRGHAEAVSGALEVFRGDVERFLGLMEEGTCRGS